MKVSPPPGACCEAPSPAPPPAVPGATVQVYTQCTSADHCSAPSFTLTAGADGSYQWWLPASDSPLQVIAAKDSSIQQVTASLAAGGAASSSAPGQTRRPRPQTSGATTVLNFALANYKPPMP